MSHAHELSEKLAGLASRVNNLAVLHTGADSRKLLEIQDRLSNLVQLTIVKELNSQHEAFIAAINGLNDAINFIGETTEKIEKVAKAIKLASKAAALAEKAIKTAAA
jgi:hypothetical protein